ncbi:MAG: hypothetical protein Q7R41_12265 [Phycisphaerales bacterium]|nr:hypothetical protein [Phycisphaerales bacterium]
MRLARVCVVAVIVAGLASGCASPAGPIFEEPSQTIAWPPPPKPARIRYVGQLTGSADLKPARSGLEKLGALLVGKKEPYLLYGPRAVVCTPDGQRVWIADPGGRCLHLFDLERRNYRKITKAGDAHLLAPVGVCPGPPGSIYVCDSEATAIYELSDRDGTLIAAMALPEEIERPVALYYDGATEELYVVDVTAHNIKVLGTDGSLRRMIGRRGSGPGEFNFPTAISADDKNLWIADSGNHRVQAIDRAGEPVATFGQVGDAPGDLALPKSVAVDSTGHVYVVDGRFENVQIFDGDGRLLLFFGDEGTGPGEFWLPGGIFIEPTGRIWVCDSYNRRVQVFQYAREAASDP